MKFWLDSQLSPAIASWLRDAFGVEAYAVRDVGLRDATDTEIFFAARAAGAVVVTKDSDFVELSLRCGAPPQVVWVTSGNTSNRALWEKLVRTFPKVLRLLELGEPIVEIQ